MAIEVDLSNILPLRKTKRASQDASSAAKRGGWVLRPTLVHGKKKTFYALRRMKPDTVRPLMFVPERRKAVAPGRYAPPHTEPEKLAVRHKHDYGVVMIAVPDPLKRHLMAWAKQNIPVDILVQSQGGYVEDMHVTIRYGLVLPPSVAGTKRVIAALTALARSEAPGSVTLGRIGLFQTEQHDVVKVNVTSPALQHLHRTVSSLVNCKETFPQYLPHITLAYVRPGSAGHLSGLAPFLGLPFRFDELELSDRDGHVTLLPLGEPRPSGKAPASARRSGG